MTGINWDRLRAFVINTTHAVFTVASGVGFVAGIVMNFVPSTPKGVSGTLTLVCGALLAASKFIDSNHNAITNYANAVITKAQGVLGGSGTLDDRVTKAEAAIEQLVNRQPAG